MQGNTSLDLSVENVLSEYVIVYMNPFKITTKRNNMKIHINKQGNEDQIEA